jgi:hypothetical protein
MKGFKLALDANHLKPKDFGVDVPKAHLMELRSKELSDMFFETLRVKKAQEESYRNRSDFSIILNGIIEGRYFVETSRGPFNLPEPQKCGTESQKIAYARMKAQEIVEQLNEKK